jgi:UDP-glucose 4-epimerase
MTRKGILLTGGAGYIGSHTLRQLADQGENVVVLDNLCTGFREAVTGGTLIVGDIGNETLVENLVREHNIDTIMHFAAHTVVPESMNDPLKYYDNNTVASLALMRAAARQGVPNFVFSSTAAVYGMPASGVASEDTPPDPINPYGSSKLAAEWILSDLARATSMRYVILRYFNVAGSATTGELGQRTKNATLLTKVACEAAVGRRPNISIYGTDYATPDGTGIRDYIHVDDIARAHLDGLRYLRSGGASVLLNCGYGHGYSVREVIDSVQRVSGRKLQIIEEPRRPGDTGMLIAKADKIRNVLGWQPEHDELDFIIGTALAWEKRQLAETLD